AGQEKAACYGEACQTANKHCPILLGIVKVQEPWPAVGVQSRLGGVTSLTRSVSEDSSSLTLRVNVRSLFFLHIALNQASAYNFFRFSWLPCSGQMSGRVCRNDAVYLPGIFLLMHHS